jgi:hypothetical protein
MSLPGSISRLILPGEEVLWQCRPPLGPYILNALLFPSASGFWHTLFAPLRAGHVRYLVTDRRILLTTGLLGRGLKTIPHEMLVNIVIGPGLGGTGTLLLYSGQLGDEGEALHDDLVAVPDALQVYQTIEAARKRLLLRTEGGDLLAQLGALVETGLLTEEEWARVKALLLADPPDAREQTLRQFAALAELRHQGILSDSEFNMKRVEILTRREKGKGKR